ncbi:hypothetical protein [Bathymodiolus japonicus methanotrophic gill symbiont]|uniref:hypothetical protein n=1 Tax=Bathymodiolus japonicus methanotrophic gill symbiont TaxID=113269 RepID=UPI001C8D7C06|nr:hypothetical protein [Bathymodiolus japonicus methanotrophic gill symbiont]
MTTIQKIPLLIIFIASLPLQAESLHGHRVKVKYNRDDVSVLTKTITASDDVNPDISDFRVFDFLDMRYSIDFKENVVSIIYTGIHDYYHLQVGKDDRFIFRDVDDTLNDITWVELIWNNSMLAGIRRSDITVLNKNEFMIEVGMAVCSATFASFQDWLFHADTECHDDDSSTGYLNQIKVKVHFSNENTTNAEARAAAERAEDRKRADEERAERVAELRKISDPDFSMDGHTIETRWKESAISTSNHRVVVTASDHVNPDIDDFSTLPNSEKPDSYFWDIDFHEQNIVMSFSGVDDYYINDSSGFNFYGNIVTMPEIIGVEVIDTGSLPDGFDPNLVTVDEYNNVYVDLKGASIGYNDIVKIRLFFAKTPELPNTDEDNSNINGFNNVGLITQSFDTHKIKVKSWEVKAGDTKEFLNEETVNASDEVKFDVENFTIYTEESSPTVNWSINFHEDVIALTNTSNNYMHTTSAGFYFEDVDDTMPDILGVIAFHNYYAPTGFDPSLITFDANHIYVDLKGSNCSLLCHFEESPTRYKNRIILKVIFAVDYPRVDTLLNAIELVNSVNFPGHKESYIHRWGTSYKRYYPISNNYLKVENNTVYMEGDDYEGLVNAGTLDTLYETYNVPETVDTLQSFYGHNIYVNYAFNHLSEDDPKRIKGEKTVTVNSKINPDIRLFKPYPEHDFINWGINFKEDTLELIYRTNISTTFSSGDKKIGFNFVDVDNTMPDILNVSMADSNYTMPGFDPSLIVFDKDSIFVDLSGVYCTEWVDETHNYCPNSDSPTGRNNIISLKVEFDIPLEQKRTKVDTKRVDALFDTLETEYPQYFPDHKESYFLEDSTDYVRYYASTDFFLKVKDNKLYFEGGEFDSESDRGTLDSMYLLYDIPDFSRIDLLFYAVELKYPSYFPSHPESSVFDSGYYGRYYPTTKNYMGIKDKGGYVWGDSFGGVVYTGTLDSLYTEYNIP